jgi:hypothetical protein
MRETLDFEKLFELKQVNASTLAHTDPQPLPEPKMA